MNKINRIKRISFLSLYSNFGKENENPERKVQVICVILLKRKHCIRHMWCVHPKCQKREKKGLSLTSKITKL